MDWLTSHSDTAGNSSSSGSSDAANPIASKDVDHSTSGSRQQQRQQPTIGKDVLKFLQHFSRHDQVNLRQSRAGWLASVTKSCAFIGGLKRPADRLAMTRYLFTGEEARKSIRQPCVMCRLRGF